MLMAYNESYTFPPNLKLSNPAVPPLIMFESFLNIFSLDSSKQKNLPLFD